MRSLKKFSQLILPLCMLLVAFFSLFHSGAKSFWLDETYSALLAQKSIGDMFHILWFQDGNAWLYYILLHFWIVFGTTEAVIRSFSAIVAVLVMPAVYLLAARLFNSRVANVAIVLLSVNAFFIAYAQEARGYMLLILLTTLSIYFFLRSIENPTSKNHIGYVICSALALYTHLFAALIIMSQFITLLVSKRKQLLSMKIMISYLFLILLVSPLFLAPAFRSGQLNFIGGITLGNIAGLFLALAGGLPLLFILYYGILAGGILVQIKKKTINNFIDWKYQLVAISFLFPIVFTFAFSIFVKSIYDPRYLLVSLVPFIIVLSVSFIEIKKLSKKVFNTFVIIVIISSLASLSVFFSGNDHLLGPWSISKAGEDWRGATNFVVDNANPRDAVIFFAYFTRYPFSYYFDQNSNKVSSRYLDILELSSSPYPPGGGSYQPEPDIKLLNNLPDKYNRVWLILSHHRSKQLGRDKQSALIQAYLTKFYKLTNERTFYGDINVYLYEKSSK